MTVKTLPLITLLFTFICASSLSAEEFFEIERVKRDKAFLYVESQWHEDTPCVTVYFRVAEDLRAENLITRAYFFDKNQKLIFKQNTYSSWSTGNADLLRLDNELEGGRRNEIYFGLPERFDNEWHRVVVVFAVKGQPSTITKKIYPEDDIEAYPTPGQRP